MRRGGEPRIPPANLHVPRDAFLAVWREADRRRADEEHDEFVAAVAATCRWLAAVRPRTALCGGLPRSPVTHRSCLARPGSIEAEWQAVQRDETVAGLAVSDVWREGARATLRWAWCLEGPPPIAAEPATRPSRESAPAATSRSSPLRPDGSPACDRDYGLTHAEVRDRA